MTIVTKEIAPKHTLIVPDEMVCDRCGKEGRKMVGVGVSSGFPFEGVYVRGHLYPTGNVADQQDVEFELCGDCTVQLRGWIEG